MSKNGLIQPVKFRIWETGLCKMLYFEMLWFTMFFKQWLQMWLSRNRHENWNDFEKLGIGQSQLLADWDFWDYKVYNDPTGSFIKQIMRSEHLPNLNCHHCTSISVQKTRIDTYTVLCKNKGQKSYISSLFMKEIFYSKYFNLPCR